MASKQLSIRLHGRQRTSANTDVLYNVKNTRVQGAAEQGGKLTIESLQTLHEISSIGSHCKELQLHTHAVERRCLATMFFLHAKHSRCNLEGVGKCLRIPTHVQLAFLV
jgi:hypothetical protein